jgi:long-chain acyl-CoA synthetase
MDEPTAEAREYPPIGPAAGAERHPERLAVSDEFGVSLTYRELDDKVNQVIRALYGLGMRPGDVFTVLLENRAEAVLLHQVAYRGGFFFTPINPRLQVAEIEYLLADSQAGVLFLDMVHADLAEEITAPEGLRIVKVGAGSNDGLAEMIATASSDQVEHQFGSVMSYTSGTTGRPKAVARERRRPSPEALPAVLDFGLRLGFDPDHDRHLATAPLYHGGPLISAMHAINLLGSVYLMRRFEPRHVLELVEEHQITSAYMVPTMYHRILQLPESVRAAADTSSLRSIMHTGGPCPPDLKQRMIDWLGPIMYECYAATEGYGTYTVCTSEQWLSHPGTVGIPEHDVITIRDENGKPLPTGETGLVYAKTLPGVEPFEYKNDPEKTASAYSQHGDYTLGDMGFLDSDGYLYLTGRATDMIISGGVNVYPAEAEQALLKHDHVRDVAVLGVPDEEWGESVVAVVQLGHPAASDVSADDLIAYCRTQIASYKCPREVYFVDDLGRDPSGKLRKRVLREKVIDPDQSG